MIFVLFLQIEWQAINKPYNADLQELVIYFTIPDNKLKFIAEDSLFYTNYESQLKVFDSEDNQVAGDYWQTKRPEDTLVISDSIKLLIPKSSSYFDLRIVDLHGGDIFKVSEKILPINYLANIKWLITNDTLRVSFMVINTKEDAYRIRASINAIEKNIPARAGLYGDTVLLSIADLPIDAYTLKFEVFSESQKLDEIELPIKISRPFYLDDVVWSLKVAQLEYIASASERGVLERASVEERDSLWQYFWKQHDPTPNTKYNEKEVEYFTRIQYCEENFSHGDTGWRSDRARIYMTYGPPDEIVSRPYELSSYPYLEWYYYSINRKFIFVDRYGFGRYIVLNPTGSSI